MSISLVSNMTVPIVYTGERSETPVEQIVTVVHCDLHDPLSLRGFEQMADCILRLSLVDSASVNTLHCSTIVKRSTGKVIFAVSSLCFTLYALQY